MTTKPTTAAEIRRAFLDFFNELRHEIVSSSPLPQYDNPTLLFTNAGMNQFADVFLGKEKRPYSRAVSSQKCMRVSGKHNDLENVGPSPRHHTFFEMLGNFSFGDYFKSEAIDYAWAFLTGVMGLEPERLWATIYLDDDESFELWQRYLPAEKIKRFGKKDNFWEMGDVGPCGPNSEVHYFTGPLDQVNPDVLNADDDETFLEVWNLVFMQFNREPDGSLTPLPKPSVDTGLGLERLARIMQGTESNYETDLFMPAMDRVQALLGDDDAQRAAGYVGYRVIADHGRAATFLIGDGVIPGNTGAPYVLRMIIRRAARFGRKIGFTGPFLGAVAQVYIDTMGDAYPDLRARRDFILTTLAQEEERFARTLDRALGRLDDVFGDLHDAGRRVIPGDIAFDLHATYGLPLEITRDIALERGYTVDEKGFVAAREAHAQASGGGAFDAYDTGLNVYADLLHDLVRRGLLEADGVQYDPYSGPVGAAPVVALLVDGQPVTAAAAGTTVELITSGTPFYAEAGGEVGDSGTIRADGAVVQVNDTRKPKGAEQLVVHHGTVTHGTVSVGAIAELAVDDARRGAIRRNHTATHILHRELRARLGTHVTQQGSLVAPDRLRFDFSHTAGLSEDELTTIEAAINDAILANYAVSAEYSSRDEAIGRGAMALFGEKYGDVVRTIAIGDGRARPYSLELCGGLHVGQTGEIGAFFFTSEGSVAAGVRRVEAVTGAEAYRLALSDRRQLADVGRKLGAQAGELGARVDAVLHENRQLQREVETLRRQVARSQFDALLAQMQVVDGVNLLVGAVSGVSAETLREMADWFRDRVASGVAVLATVSDDRPLFIATVTDDVVGRGVKAGDLVREMGKLTGGGGGGRPQLAQAGGRDAARLPQALDAVPGLIRSALK